MGRWIPVEVLEHVEHPVFIANEEGRVEYCNSATARLLKRDRHEIEGRSCWDVMRLRSPEGKLLCRAQCAIQAQARNGTLEKVRPALFAANGDPLAEIELLAVGVSPPIGRRVAMLHVIKVAASGQARGVAETGRREEPAASSCLSPREREVLRHLTSGRRTDQIAGDLFLSRATVRNHVRSILTKMNVHSRIEAVLAAVARR